ncbi:MAG TPA: (d)CMP kinase [Salinivirgaceae bacterium]|nr:(d)CMP kinase [Salinivirgaceae bacterium]
MHKNLGYMDNIVIAVDGFSSCGKSTLAKDIAKELGLIYIDTGAMYRGATLLAIEHNLISNNTVEEEKLIEILKSTTMVFKKVEGQVQLYLNDRNVENEIRSMEVSNNVSLVSTIAEVRSILVDRQRTLGKSMNVILDGRDIGTVVFPNADIKLFLTASPEIRAQRRYDEMKKKGDNVTLSEVAKNIQNRDFIDQNREVSPLKKADDAYVIDNSNMSKQEQLQHAISIIKLKRPDIFKGK